MQKLTIVNAILFLFFAITALVALVLLETQKRMIMFSGAHCCWPLLRVFVTHALWGDSVIAQSASAADPIAESDRGLLCAIAHALSCDGDHSLHVSVLKSVALIGVAYS